MDYRTKFLRDESGAAEAAPVALMIAMSSGLSGMWYGLINNHNADLLVAFIVIFLLWIVLKA